MRTGCLFHELYSDYEISAIENHANRILDEVGVEFRGDEEALELFRVLGARVHGDEFGSNPGWRRTSASCTLSRSRCTVGTAGTLPIGGDNVAFLPAYGSPFVTDLDQGRRYATLADFENIVKDDLRRLVAPLGRHRVRTG